MATEMNKKYELTEEINRRLDGTVLHRIRAVEDFTLADGTEVHAGDLGGWVEREHNLSHSGNAWVSEAALIRGSARVLGSARVYGSAEVYGSAWISGSAQIYGSARVFGDAEVFGSAQIYGLARILGEAEVCGSARVYDLAAVDDSARVCGSAEVCGSAFVYNSATVSGSAVVCGHGQVCDSALVYDSAKVSDSAVVCGHAQVCGCALVRDTFDYTVYKNSWSSGRWFTYTRSDGMWKVGCFRGTGEELIAKAYRDSNMSGQCSEAIVRAQEAIDKAKAHSNNHGEKEG